MHRSSRLFIAALMLAAPACLTAYPPISAAEAEALSPDQIAAFHTKLDGAEASRVSLAKRAECLNGYLVDLQSRTAKYELDLGFARRRESELATQMAQLEKEREGFARQVDVEKRNYDSKREEYDRALSKYRDQESRKGVCSWFLGRTVCQGGEDLVKMAGFMEDAKRQFESAAERLQRAQNNLTDMQGRLDSAGKELSRARSETASNQDVITRLNAEISKAKASNAVLNSRIQDYNTQIADLTTTLKAAGEVDSAYARGKRRVERLSSEIDELSSGIPAFAASVDLGLPEDAKARCPR